MEKKYGPDSILHTTNKKLLEEFEETVKKRGRPKTGQKTYKNITIRLEKEKFENLEKLAQEKSGVSIHTYAKDNINKIFELDVFDIILPTKITELLSKIDTHNKTTRKINTDINNIAGMYIEDYLVETVFLNFQQEYMMKKIEIPGGDGYFTIIEGDFKEELNEIRTLINIHHSQPREFKIELREIIEKKMINFLEKKPSQSELLNFYFFEYLNLKTK